MDSVRRDQWDMFFERAALDPAEMLASEPGAESLFPADQRSAWRAPHPTGEEGPVHVEAMARGGRPLFFAVGRSDQERAAARHLKSEDAREVFATTSLRVVLLLITIVAIPWAWASP